MKIHQETFLQTKRYLVTVDLEERIAHCANTHSRYFLLINKAMCWPSFEAVKAQILNKGQGTSSAR